MSGSGARDLKRITRQLRTQGDAKKLRAGMTRELRAAVKPVERKVKANARALPASGPASTGLRRLMAAAVGIQVRTSGKSAGVKLRIARARMGDQASLPRDTNLGHWRHPVFGRRVWVAQASRAGWFDRPARQAKPQIQRAVKRVLDRLEKKLTV